MVAALLTCTGAWSQTVPDNIALLGMRPQQLESLPVAPEVVRSPRRLSSGAMGLLRIPDVLCEGMHFEQTLFFAHGVLEQTRLVLLVSMPAISGTPAVGSLPAGAAYVALMNILRRQFGSELSSSDATSDNSMASASWVSGDADVMLFRSGKPGRVNVRLVIKRRKLVNADEL